MSGIRRSEGPKRIARNVDEVMFDFSSSIAHLEFPPKQRLGLMTLPQEIQDMIFDLAYPTIDGFKIVTKEGWADREQESFRKSSSGYDARPFPRPKVCDFLVSKDFFLAAARAYVGNQTFDDTVRSRMTGPVSILRHGLDCDTIIGRFMTSIILGSFHFHMLFEMPPNLKSMTFNVTEKAFNAVKSKRAWEEHLSDVEFEMIVASYSLDRISGLVEFRLVPGRCRYATTDSQLGKWHENVRKLEDFMRPIVTRPREDKIRIPRIKPINHLETLFGDLQLPLGAPWLEIQKKEKLPRRKTERTDRERRYRAEDIPTDLEEFKVLLNANGEKMMAWIQKARQKELKRRLAW